MSTFRQAITLQRHLLVIEDAIHFIREGVSVNDAKINAEKIARVTDEIIDLLKNIKQEGNW